jgi:two-component system sensor histidine kinase MprB
MSLRLKIVLALVLLATCATAVVGASSYISTRDELNGVVDQSLLNAASNLTPASLNRLLSPPPTAGQGGRGPGSGPGNDPDHDGDIDGSRRQLDALLYQVVLDDGATILLSSSAQLPISETDAAIARGDRPDDGVPHDVKIGGESFRMLTIHAKGQVLSSGVIIGDVGAVQFARSGRETQRALAVIRTRTLLSVALVIVAAAILGWLIGRQVTRRLVRLTQAADDVATTGRLDVDVPVGGTDETGRLGAAFNGMLGALARSRDQQQQLVQDAGHELRTPLTSLRTNVSVLRRFEALAPDTRMQLLADLDSETKELTALVNELVELATDRRDDESPQECHLGTLCEQAAARVRRRTGREITVVADTSTVRCRPLAIDRAIHNLVDNAAKFSPDGPIEVAVADCRVTVSDRGPGIPAEDLPHVFDRFFRSVASRSQPGSGLGLAIVRDIVESHGGTVLALARDGGGSVVGFTLPAGVDE